MIDTFVDADLEVEIEGVTRITGEFPYRAFGLIEFYKLIKDKYKIIMINLDVENHVISFCVSGVIDG